MQVQAGDDLRSHSGPAPVEGEYAGLLTEMQDLGLLSDLENELPEGFSAVFEIGRILADPESDLAHDLSPATSLVAAALGEDPMAGLAHPEVERIELTAGEEYEAEFIRTWSDVQYVYAWQHLLPEEEFLRRLAKRTLWFPMAKAPLIRGIDVGDDDYNPSPSKQKVYVLLDTSSSMRLRYRFPYAKAIALRFLRENRREMGEVFLRTFDVELGPLHTARDANEFDVLLRQVARQEMLGNGTVLERAIVTACADIRENQGLSGAEILVVTDGAARIRVGHVERALGDDIRLHCVKIGGAKVFATKSYIEERLDFAQLSDTRLDQRILQARKQKEKLEDSLSHEPDAGLRRAIERALREVQTERDALAAELKKEYGHEIERVANVYVGVPDLNPADVFRMSAERLYQLQELVRRITHDLTETPARADVLKQAALLLAHVKMLAQEQDDPETQELLEGLQEHLELCVEVALEEHEERFLDAQLLAPSDQRDLKFLLRRGTGRYSSLWTLLLRLFYATVTRWAGGKRKR
jgi:hypothetical protein